MRPLRKIIVKLAQPQVDVYNYGHDKYQSACNDYKWTRSWTVHQSTIMSLLQHYSRFAITKVKIVFSNFKLENYWYLGMPEKKKKDGSSVEGSKWPDEKTRSLSHIQFLTEWRKGNNDMPEVMMEGGDDSTRTIVFWKNYTATNQAMSLEPSGNEHSKKYVLRRGLKFSSTIYTKPKKYLYYSKSEPELPAALDILKRCGCPDQVTESQIFVGPLMDGNEPLATSKNVLRKKIFTYNAALYITVNFAGRYVDM